jgi:hypothetical protein
MRTLPLLAATLLAATPALAQTDAAPPPPPPHHHHHHHRPPHAAAAGERPVDLGPNTPDANRAYQGGGVILQGAPGAPAPTPQATPPGQVPANAVPR